MSLPEIGGWGELTLPNKVYDQSSVKIPIRQFASTRRRRKNVAQKTERRTPKQGHDGGPSLRLHGEIRGLWGKEV